MMSKVGGLLQEATVLSKSCLMPLATASNALVIARFIFGTSKTTPPGLINVTFMRHLPLTPRSHGSRRDSSQLHGRGRSGSYHSYAGPSNNRSHPARHRP